MIVEDTEYRIACQCLNSQQYVPIDKKEYEDIRVAHQGLLEARYLEEKYDSLIENFYEYEQEVSKLATRHMLFGNYDYTKFQDEINLINRRIVNLLTTCRLYVDHGSHHLNQIFNGDKAKKDEVKRIRHNVYDSTLGYRVMETFRNYVQHHGFPIHNFVYGSKRVEEDKESKLLFSVTAHMDVEVLSKGGKFKKSVLSELLKKGQRHDINIFIREYMAGMSMVHVKYRAMIRDQMDHWEDILDKAIKKYKLVVGDDASILGLSAIVYEKDAPVKTVPIFLEPIKYRKYLENKNGSLSSLPSRYVDNSIGE